MMWGFYGGWDWLLMAATMVLFWTPPGETQQVISATNLSPNQNNNPPPPHNPAGGTPASHFAFLSDLRRRNAE